LAPMRKTLNACWQTTAQPSKVVCYKQRVMTRAGMGREKPGIHGRILPTPYCSFPVVARSPDRATRPTEGLLSSLGRGCSSANPSITIPPMECYRIHPDAAVYYLTYSVVEWLPVFVSEASCKILTQSLTFCHREKQLRINAYVVMPT